MPRRTSGAMHVVTTRRHYKDTVYETHLLRRTFREGGKVKNETLANLSHLPPEALEAVQRVLHGEHLVADTDTFSITRSLRHGDAAAVLGMARRLGFAELLGQPSAVRDVVLGLVCAQVLEPQSKAAYTSWFSDTTLGVDLGLVGRHTDALYEAMDFLLGHKERIETALVSRHLGDGSFVCYDLSSSFVEGSHNELAAFGHSRDGKRGKRQIEYGVIATTEGLPVAIEVFPGNTADPKSFMEIVETTKARFGLSRVVFVGDRGMITSARIGALKDVGGFGWVTALRSTEIKALVSNGAIQQSLFDEVNLAEIAHPDYEGERLVACKNPFLAAERARKREALLIATEDDLAKVAAAVSAGRLRDPGKIGLRAGRVLNRHKMAKHFEIEITDGHFSYSRKNEAIEAEAALDGIYVIRTSEDAESLSPQAVVATYKSLANIERDFRTMKSVDLHIRPIRHRLADRVRSHAFICLLAAHLVWHLRKAWAPLTFRDEAPPERTDPVAPAVRSASASAKAAARRRRDGQELRPFQGLLDHLGTLTRNTCQVPGTTVTFERLAEPTETQRRSFELIDIPVPLRLV
ncbi:MAG: IS1634 family transposase [Acidimicrobiales bacterium]